MKSKMKIEDENSLISFYRNNKVIVWLLVIIIVAIIILKFIPFNNNSTTPTKDNIIITIEPSNNVSISKDTTINLAAIINVDDAIINWTSSNENIAKVNNGSVTGINSGKTTIIASYVDKDGNRYTATKEVEVIEGNSNISLNSVSFKDGDLYMASNTTYHLGLIFSPNNAKINSKIFASSNENVVIVDNDGLVKAVGEGYSRIIVTVNEVYKTAIDVYVNNSVKNPGIIVSPTIISFDSSSRKIKVGSSETLKYHITPNNITNTILNWTSSDSSIVIVDQFGKITAKKEGIAKITLSSINGKKDEIDITVYNDLVEVESISLLIDNITIEAGKTEVITPVVLPSNASNKGLTYSSSDVNVVTATPNADGTEAILSAIKKGTATITISSGNKEKVLTVNVIGNGNNSEIYEDEVKPTTIVVRSDKNNLAKTFDEAREIPVYGKTNVSITLRDGVGKIRYCISKYGSNLCNPNIEIYANDSVEIPSGGMYVLRIIKYDHQGNEISSKSVNYVDGVLNYYINTLSSSMSYTVVGAYDTETAARSYPTGLNSKVDISLYNRDTYLKACATNGANPCTPSNKITTNYSYTLNKEGIWHIIVNEYDKNNKQIGNSKVYYAFVVKEETLSQIDNGQVKASNLKINDGGQNGKYLSVDVESDLSFYNVRFCYVMVNKSSFGTCNLDTTSGSVPYYNNGNIVRPKEEGKTYYATLASTKKYTFKFYLDGLDTIYNNSDTNKDILFEFAVKTSNGFTNPIKIRINMTNKYNNSASWKTLFIK